MERTERNFPPDDTPKPLIRQDFSESRFQNDTSFSSQARYDHFDTLPCKNYSILGTDNMISSQARYDHFDTAPYSILHFAAPKKYDFEGFRISPVMTTSIPPLIFSQHQPPKMRSGKRRELMERTEKIFPPDDTPKPLIRQGFSESRFQNGTSVSNQGSYNHFDTAA